MSYVSYFRTTLPHDPVWSYGEPRKRYLMNMCGTDHPVDVHSSANGGATPLPCVFYKPFRILRYAINYFLSVSILNPPVFGCSLNLNLIGIVSLSGMAVARNSIRELGSVSLQVIHVIDLPSMIIGIVHVILCPGVGTRKIISGFSGCPIWYIFVVAYDGSVSTVLLRVGIRRNSNGIWWIVAMASVIWFVRFSFEYTIPENLQMSTRGMISFFWYNGDILCMRT